MGSAEFAKYPMICTSHEQEIEADIVSARYAYLPHPSLCAR